MNRAIGSMLANPEEAWFVIDGVLLALSHAPVELQKKSISGILPWLTHEDWWLRESAFFALVGLQQDQALFVEQLPTMLKVMTSNEAVENALIQPILLFCLAC